MARFGCTITVAAGKAPSAQTDFSWVAVTANFPSAAIDGSTNAINNGGGNLRAYTDDTKGTQIPVEIVTFVTGGSPNVLIWGLLPSLNVGSTVYIEADTTATSQPATSASFGRDAVWVDSIAVYHGEGLTDSTGKGQDLVEEGSPSIVSGKIGNAYQTSGVNNSGGNAYIATLSSSETSAAITAWLKRGGSGYESAVTVSNNTTLEGGAKDYIAISANNSSEYRASFRGASNAYKSVSVGSSANNVWQMVTASYLLSSNTIGVNVQGVGSSSTSGFSNSLAYNKVILGRENNTSGSSDLFAWDGLINQVNVRDSSNFPSADRLESEYNNQDSPSTFWTTSAWEAQGLITIVPSGIGSAEGFGSVSLTTGVVLISPSGITSLEGIGDAVVRLLLHNISILGINSQEGIPLPVVTGGDVLLIPVSERATWNRIALYLRGIGFKGSNNDVIVSWLRSEGIINGSYNDLWIRYLNANGITETNLGDAYAKWRQ